MKIVSWKIMPCYITYNYGTTGTVIKRQSTNKLQFRGGAAPWLLRSRARAVPAAPPPRRPTPAVPRAGLSPAPALQSESCSYSQGGKFCRKPRAEEGVVCQAVMRCKEEPVTSSTKGW